MALVMYWDRKQPNAPPYIWDTSAQKWYTPPGQPPYEPPAGADLNTAPGTTPPVGGQGTVGNPSPHPYDPNYNPGQTPPAGGDGGGDGDGGIDVQEGMWWQLEQERIALEKYIADLQAQTNRDIAEINRQAAAELAAKNAELERELLDKRISHEQFMQQRELAQRESEFSRDLALRTLIADRQNAIDQAQLELNRMAEIRQERLLHAQLASNPADTVLYEYFKRGGGTPQAMDLAKEQANQGYRSLLGDYPAPPPAYSDEALQKMFTGITGDQRELLYNPNLGGTGAFGVDVPSPGEMSHSAMSNMDPNSLAVLESFIRGGVETSPGGPRVAINPEDWFTQAKRSWIPGLQTTQTQYQ